MRLLGSALSLVCIALATPLWSSDSTFKHPQGFSVLVPDGWTAESQKGGVVISKGTANVDVFAFPGNGSPESLIDAIEPQITKQWRSIKKLKQAACPVVGSGNGVCAWYSGVNPKGESTGLKVIALVQQEKGYLLFVEVPQENTSAFSADLNRIEKSFSVSAVTENAPAPAQHPVDPQKLAALDQAYQDGQISTEEYERRKQQLHGGGAATSDPGGPGTGPAPANPQQSPPQNSLPGEQRPAAPKSAVPAQSPRRQGSTGGSTGQRFESPDGFFSTSIPQGWMSVPPGPASNGLYFMAPSNGGGERIMFGSGPLFVTSIQQVVSAAFLTIRALYPGLQLVGQPKYFSHNGSPAAEFYLRGLVANGTLVNCWYSVIMGRNRYYYVLSLALPRSAQRVEQDARIVFSDLQF